MPKNENNVNINNMYVYYNPNPAKNSTSDCVVRSICKLMDIDWDTAFTYLYMQGFELKDMMDKNYVWGELLYRHGYKRYPIPDTCPNCYTVINFCEDHPEGKYLLALGTHVVTVVDGVYYDTWDSGNEVPIYYWKKEEE